MQWTIQNGPILNRKITQYEIRTHTVHNNMTDSRNENVASDVLVSRFIWVHFGHSFYLESI